MQLLQSFLTTVKVFSFGFDWLCYQQHIAHIIVNNVFLEAKG